MKKQHFRRLVGAFIAPIVLFATLVGTAHAGSGTGVLENFWTGGRLQLSGENLVVEAIKTNNPVAQWTMEKMEGTSFVRFKYHDGTYLNIENGPVVTSDIHEGAFSSQWTLEPVPNTPFYRLKNHWKNTYLNIEHEELVSSPIQEGAFSSWWWFAD